MYLSTSNCLVIVKRSKEEVQFIVGHISYCTIVVTNGWNKVTNARRDYHYQKNVLLLHPLA